MFMKQGRKFMSSGDIEAWQKNGHNWKNLMKIT